MSNQNINQPHIRSLLNFISFFHFYKKKKTKDLEIFNVKLQLTNESNCMNLRKNSQEENNPQYENESINMICLKRNNFSKNQSFDLTESQKKLLLKFNLIVQRFSIKKKMPLNLDKKIYELIDDKPNFPKAKKIEIHGIISYFIQKSKTFCS